MLVRRREGLLPDQNISHTCTTKLKFKLNLMLFNPRSEWNTLLWTQLLSKFHSSWHLPYFVFFIGWSSENYTSQWRPGQKNKDSAGIYMNSVLLPASNPTSIWWNWERIIYESRLYIFTLEREQLHWTKTLKFWDSKDRFLKWLTSQFMPSLLNYGMKCLPVQSDIGSLYFADVG